MSFAKSFIAAILVTGGLSVSAPSHAVITTFAAFSPTNTARNLRWVKTGTNGGVLYTTATGTATVPGAVNVKFTFLQPALNVYINDVTAKFSLNATTAGDPATLSAGNLTQNIDSGSFSFVTTSAITIGSHFFAAGSNLLSGTFTNAALFGQNGGSSGSFSGSTDGGNVVTFSSDFLDFSNTVTRDFAIAMTSINPVLNRPTSALNSLRSFRATSSGTFSSDPAPGITILPEAATWGMMLAGFGLVGVVARRRKLRTVAA